MTTPHTDPRPITVSVLCLAYNQAPYIRQTLAGFAMQRTTFRFEAVVHDDASTDGTADIIRAFAADHPHIICPVLETENQYSKRNGSLGRAVEREIRGKYVAWCEGDDWWTDPDKLQTQVDYMEAHPECAFCCADVRAHVQATGQEREWQPAATRAPEHPDTVWLLRHNTVSTLTALCRADLYRRYHREVVPGLPRWPMGDYPLWLWLSAQGTVWHWHWRVGMYRVLGESASHSRSLARRYAFGLAEHDVRIFMARRLGLPARVRLRLLARRLRFVCAWGAHYKEWRQMLRGVAQTLRMG